MDYELLKWDERNQRWKTWLRNNTSPMEFGYNSWLHFGPYRDPRHYIEVKAWRKNER